MKKKSKKTDLPLKLMCKSMYNAMLYCCHYEVKLRTKSYIEQYTSHDVSDIDVLGYKFFPDLSYFSIGAECKSGKASALSEIYKFIGVINYFGLDRGYFIKSKIHQNARQVCLEQGMINYTEAEFRKLLIGFEIDIDKTLKIEKARYNRFVESSNYAKVVNEKLHKYITYEYWNRENWRNIHNIMYLLNPQKGISITDITPNLKMYYYHVIELLARSILILIRRAMNLNYSDIESSIEVVLYGKAESLRERKKLADLVKQVLGESEKFEEPWQKDFIEICNRMSSHTIHASRITNLLQYIIDDAFYDKMIIIPKDVSELYSEETRKFSQDLMQFVIKNTSLNETIFEEFMSL